MVQFAKKDWFFSSSSLIWMKQWIERMFVFVLCQEGSFSVLSLKLVQIVYMWNIF